jgi:hypothetical protein
MHQGFDVKTIGGATFEDIDLGEARSAASEGMPKHPHSRERSLLPFVPIAPGRVDGVRRGRERLRFGDGANA